jgi:5-methylcytosine-specific restriction protein B
LHPTLEADFRKIHDNLTSRGEIPTSLQLQGYYDAFRRRFGPEVLRALGGVDLLERMHAHGSRDSMVYWLEFKDDEEFPAHFGSIAGGSALKFGVYKRAETGTWATKGNGHVPKDISVDEAVEIAERHRDQLLAAVEVLAARGPDATDDGSMALQEELRRMAPDVENTAWGHKYMSLLFPDRIDDLHVEDFQRYNLYRLLQLPPRVDGEWASGRYVCSGRYVALAQELGISLNATTTLLNHRHGSPRQYWRVGTTDDESERRKYWPMMRDGEVIAIGWPRVGDLSQGGRMLSRDAIKELVAEHYGGVPQRVGRDASELNYFVGRMSDGDRVVAADGAMVLGVGEISGPYEFDGGSDVPHQRPVNWLSTAEWHLNEGLRSTVFRLKSPETFVEIERHILEDEKPRRPATVAPRSPRTGRSGGPLPRLSGVPLRVQAVLERKGQVILYGPPGTGKTYWALRTCRDLAALRAFGSRFDELTSDEKARVNEGESEQGPLVRLTSFHPEYGYEDFIEGYRPGLADGGSMQFVPTDGVFRRVCDDAADDPTRDYYLIIDEINRGDVPRIFGELLTLLELDKRGEFVRLPISGKRFTVPPNVFVVGTMNTADRSVALLDVALRRRFGFVELMPDYSVLENASVGGLPLGPWLKDLNARIRATGGGDARNRQVGHAFLLSGGSPISSIHQLSAVLRDDLLPLLEEYCYDDFSQMAEIVGTKLIDGDAQRIRIELFEAGRGRDLIAALMRPEIVTAADAVAVEPPGEGEDGEDSADIEDATAE